LHYEQTVDELRKSGRGSMSHLMSPCLHDPVSMSMSPYLHVSMSPSPCPHVSMFLQMENGTNIKRNFRLFSANRKRKRQTSVYLLQMETENGCLFFLVGKR
jgi:hypothetical protein